MTTDLLDDPFHAISLAAYVIVAAESGQWPPDSETVRRRAYNLYEAELRRDPPRTLAHAANPAYPARELPKEPAS